MKDFWLVSCRFCFQYK